MSTRAWSATVVARTDVPVPKASARDSLAGCRTGVVPVRDTWRRV
ncbi:hypothetical protein [Nocardia implantans]|uniref:Uncharacterized protein n=1 Tax=Nocardia implantans TaxID=3108168 RepID=A0ABU6AV88_9NOCA|nr:MULTISPECIES: hypothetical protein [unclassified Nocardia]MEA3527381.1 hypothetical protein [Nocardia sp. CDC192]MEB3511089.1 hypothetical protein [Nocardia sp. CDC186]